LVEGLTNFAACFHFLQTSAFSEQMAIAIKEPVASGARARYLLRSPHRKKPHVRYHPLQGGKPLSMGWAARFLSETLPFGTA